MVVHVKNSIVQQSGALWRFKETLKSLVIQKRDFTFKRNAGGNAQYVPTRASKPALDETSRITHRAIQPAMERWAARCPPVTQRTGNMRAPQAGAAHITRLTVL
jgi:hypothetical protein